MRLEKIKNYFVPKSILGIGANVGQLYNELVIFWKNEIPYKFFAQDNIFNSERKLIQEFYKKISTN